MSGLILLGAGSFSLVVADLAEELGYTPVACVVNRGQWAPGDRHGGLPVYDIRHPDLWPDGFDFPFVSATIWPERRGLIRAVERKGYSPVSIVHPPFGCLSKTAIIGRGCVICRRVVIESFAEIRNHVIVNRGALIGHNVTVGQYSTIGPGAILCGHVVIEMGVLVGAGAMIKEGVTIGAGATVGMGAVVVGDVEPGATVKGNPAR